MTDRQFATAGSPKDALLLQRAGAGEQAAFDDLVDRHSEPLARFAAELTDHAAEAHGVVALSFEALRERAATNSDSVGAIRPFLLASVAELLVGAEAPDPAEPSPPSFGGWDELDTAAQTALWHADVEQDPAHVVTCIVGDAIDSVHATAEKARLEVRGDFLESHLPTLPRAGCRENWFRLTDRPHDGLADASIKEHARDCEGCGPLLADARLTWTHFDEILTAQLLGSAAPAFRAARDAAPAVASSDPEPEPAGPIANPDGEPAGASEDRPPAVAARVTPAAMSKPAPAPASVMAASASVSELSRQRRGVPGVLAASGVAASVLLVVSAGALVDREGDDAVSVGGSGSTSSTTLADTVGIAPTPTLVTVGARSLTPSTDEKGRERQSADAADPETEAADPTTGSASNDLSPSPDEPESPESSPPPSDSSTPSPTDSGSESPSPSEPTESSSEPTETPTDSESPSEPTESPSESESPTESPSESDSATASPSGTSSATPSQ